jgi:exonuclease VII small subunit
MRIPAEAVSNSINRKAEQSLAQVRQTLEAILKERDAP